MESNPAEHDLLSGMAVEEADQWQGLTLVHFPAQLERILWDRGAFRGCFWGV
jgi:hypothetical protein